jgi:long-chain acyl-CoA synthetase
MNQRYRALQTPMKTVSEVAVIDIPDPRRGEKVVACVVARDACTEAELLEYCADRLAGYKWPKLIRFMEHLPKNETGKIVKRELRDLMQTAASRVSPEFRRRSG